MLPTQRGQVLQQRVIDAVAVATQRMRRRHRDATHAKTRQELELALARLRNGNPRKVPKGTAINAMSVAREAGVDRTTLYRFHEPVLTQIRKMADKEPRQQLEAKRTELAAAREKAKEYRGMLGGGAGGDQGVGSAELRAQSQDSRTGTDAAHA